MAYLALVRHGLSDYNKKGLWTGWTNVPLAPEGIEEAQKTGKELTDIHFDYGFTSTLLRAQQTLDEILKVTNQTDIPVEKNHALDEKNYGDYTGKNKWEVKEKVGEEEFIKIRRSWDFVIPNGESLKMVYERAVPYFEDVILPSLKEGKNCIIAAHGNSCRALIKYLEHISDEKISEVEIGTGEVYLYDVATDGKIIGKEVRGSNPNKHKV